MAVWKPSQGPFCRSASVIPGHPWSSLVILGAEEETRSERSQRCPQEGGAGIAVQALQVSSHCAESRRRPQEGRHQNSLLFGRSLFKEKGDFAPQKAGPGEKTQKDIQPPRRSSSAIFPQQLRGHGGRCRQLCKLRVRIQRDRGPGGGGGVCQAPEEGHTLRWE